jgi:hypothetical protein
MEHSRQLVIPDNSHRFSLPSDGITAEGPDNSAVDDVTRAQPQTAMASSINSQRRQAILNLLRDASYPADR